MPFRSQAQWRWAFANNKPWAREWARETPRRLSQLPAYSKKAATSGNFSAGAGQVIGGNQCRDENGHFANCEELNQGDDQLAQAIDNPTGSMSNYQTAMAYSKIIDSENKKIERERIRDMLGLTKPKKTGGAAKISPEERKRQQREEQKKNEANVHTTAGPGGRLGAALSAFADPENPQMIPNLLAFQLEELGLMQSSRFTNRPYISAEGRAYISAARSGDVFAAQEAMMRAQEAYQDRLEREAQMQEEQLRRQQAEAEQAYIESIEGTPFERRVQTAMQRRERMLNPKQPKGSRASRQPAPSKPTTYGSGNVIAGSPKSTVKTFKEMDDSDMPHYVPENVLKEMITGYDFARYYNINSPAMEFAVRAINGEPFTLEHIQRLKSFHDNLEVDMTVREKPTKSWVEFQIAGGSYGYHWIDQVVGAYESQMRRYKSKEDKPRVPSLSASVEAIRGLDLQYYFKRGGTDASIALARKIANRRELTEDEIRTMHSYLQRHTGDQKDGWANPANPSTAYINWQLHGGDAGLSWSSGEIDAMKLKREKPSTVFKEQFTAQERAKLRSSDFVLPGERKFPVTTAEGVKDAISSWGRYRGATTFETFKDNLIALAKRKDFASALPKEWTSERKKESDVNFSPPSGVRSAAKRGLELRSKFKRGGTAVGIARARDLSNGKNVSPQTIRRMHSFFARHAVDKRPGWSNPSKPSNGYIAHLLWGGDAGRSWAAKVDRQLDSRERKKSFEFPLHGDEQMRAKVAAGLAPMNTPRGRHRIKANEASPQKWRRMGRLMAIKYQGNRNADVLTAVQQGQRLKAKNKPNNPSLWKQAIAEAKKKYRVYPSAYANGYASQWYKKRGGTWSREKDLREWFDEKWVDLSRPKKGGGYEPCGRKTEDMSEADYRKKYPKCVPAKRAARMSDSQKRSAIQRKRDDGLPKGGKPSMVSTITKP